MSEQSKLRRVVTLPMVTLYGLGTIIGAGIFVLIGKVTGIAGIYAPLAFLVASIIAGFTALSYAELSSRFPKSAGEAVYLDRIFHTHHLSIATGVAVAAIGIISAATITNGLVGYIQLFVDLPEWMIMTLTVTVLSLLAAWGISESVKVAAATTVVSIIALLLIIIFNTENLATLPERLPEMVPESLSDWKSIALGAFIAFYAFIGFEDMINVAEEVKEPERNMPRSILLALLIATLLYILIAITSVLSLPVEVLAKSRAPLTAILGSQSQALHIAIGIISILAIADGILVQTIKTARILYGMSDQKLIPPLFNVVHPVTRTPLLATFTVALLVLFLALTFPLLTLAELTSFITLVVFGIVNFALWRLKNCANTLECAAINLPMWVPLIGFILCLVFILIQLI